MYRFLVLFALVLPCLVAHDQFIGLRFADSISSYILIKPDMTPVSEKISICAWVHKLKSRSGLYVLRYNAQSDDHEFIMYDSSYHFFMLRQGTSTGITAPLNEWHHQCITWSFATRTSKFYYNGKLITSATSPHRKLLVGGSIAIGQAHTTTTLEANFQGQAYSFGGELYELNIFSKVLTDAEISEMYGSGMCFKYDESLPESTFLKWDTLLNNTPLHNVEKFNITKCPSHTHQEPTETAELTTETSKNGTSDHQHWNILYHADFYNQEVTSELLDQIRSLWEVLAEFKGHTVDDALIRHLLKHH